MPAESLRILFSKFHSRRCQLDEAFQTGRPKSLATGPVPFGFPNFVRFPIITVVEQVDGEPQVSSRIVVHT